MRAGSLAANDIVKRLSADYVCTWTNTEGERNAGGSFAHPPSDPAPSCTRGNGNHNVQILFLTPDRLLLHAIAGYVSATDLAAELDFVDTLWAKVRRAQTPSARRYLVAGAHTRAIDALTRRPRKNQATSDRARDPRTGRPAFLDRLPEGFRHMSQRRQTNDLRFVRDHPLLPASAYRSVDHVGASNSWFGSSRGGIPKDQIGTERPRGLPDLPRPGRREQSNLR